MHALSVVPMATVNGDFCAANTCVGCRDNADCNDGNVCIDSECVPPPPGDSCADPIMYEVGTVVRGSTQNFENLLASCTGDRAPDVVYAFEAQADGPVCATTRGSVFDTALYAFAGDCNGESITCNDDDNQWEIAEGTRSTIQFDATAGETFYIVIDGWGASSGDYVLSTSQGACDEVIHTCL